MSRKMCKLCFEIITFSFKSLQQINIMETCAFQTVKAWRRRKALGGKGSQTEQINKPVTRVFLEQLLAFPDSVKYSTGS